MVQNPLERVPTSPPRQSYSPLEAFFVEGTPWQWREISEFLYEVLTDEETIQADGGRIGSTLAAKLAMAQVRRMAGAIGGVIYLIPIGDTTRRQRRTMVHNPFERVVPSPRPQGSCPLESAWLEDTPKQWREMSEFLYEVLTDEEAIEEEGGRISSALAAKLAMAQVRKLAGEIGGMNYYIPKGERLRAKELAKRVKAGFRGNNIDELARREGISAMRVRQILGNKGGSYRAFREEIERE